MLLYGANSMGNLHRLSFNPFGPTFSHVLFADNSLIFLKNAELECVFLKDLLATYMARRQVKVLTLPNLL